MLPVRNRLRLLLATSNLHKQAELADGLTGLELEFVTLADFPGVAVAPEDGTTFAENAHQKALHYACRCRLTCLADDSGLCVDALQGRPGVHSARYAGAGASDADHRAKLLREMAAVPDAGRSASFECAVAVASPVGLLFEAVGQCRGRILRSERGERGFGYDPLFLSDELQRTFAECGLEDKQRISHRGRALARARPYLARLIESIED